MQDASAFWENVRLRCKELKISQVQLCETCGINLQSHRNRVSQKQFPNLEDTYNIAQALNVSIEYLFGGIDVIGGDGNYTAFTKQKNKIFLIPFLKQHLSAGKGMLPIEELEEWEDTLSYGAIRGPSVLRRYGEKIAALPVRGDSMEPTISNGDIVICDCCGWDGEGIYALNLNGDFFIKRLSKTSTSLLIISDNPKYPMREEPLESEAIRIIGKIHTSLHNIG